HRRHPWRSRRRARFAHHLTGPRCRRRHDRPVVCRRGHCRAGADHRRTDRCAAHRHHPIHRRLHGARIRSGSALHHHGAGPACAPSRAVYCGSDEDHLMIYAISLIGATLALAFGYFLPWTITPIVIGTTYAIAALGVSVMMRAGQVSFGHSMYACISAYTVAFLARAYPGLDTIVLILAGVAAAAIAGAVVGVFVARYRSIFFGMLNLALSMVLFALLGKLYHITGGTDGLRINRPTMFGVEL